MERKTKKWRTEKLKNGYAQISKQSGICGVSLEEEKEGYGGKDLEKSRKGRF